MADGHSPVQAKFKEMLEGTKEDWDIIAEHSKHFNQGLAKRVLDHLRLLDCLLSCSLHPDIVMKQALALLFLVLPRVQAFVVPHVSRQPRFSTRQNNFFEKLLGEAFANDERLSSDKSEGQLEGPGDDDDGRVPQRSLTATQEKWRELNSKTGKVEGKTFSMAFYLSGVPNKDPSNDLYGSKVNISSRDRQVGLALPNEPTVSDIQVQFLEDGKCQCLSSTPFTNKGGGDWVVSDDGSQIRFRIKVTGYSRTVETKGTIQSVAWSDRPDQKLSSSTVYSIPEGWIYGEATISRDSRGNTKWENGILKIEQAAGLLGAGSKMTACGKFEASTIPS